MTESLFRFIDPDLEVVYVGDKHEIARGTLTMERARKFLDRIKRQRNLRPTEIAKMCSDLKSGNWKNSGNTYHFDKNLNFINGQHRCTAVLQTGVEPPDQYFWILHEEDAMEGIDLGGVRSEYDIMKLMGHESMPKNIGSAIVFENCNYQIRRLSNIEKYHIIQSFPKDLLELVADLAKGQVATAGMLAAAIGAMRNRRQEAYRFFKAAFTNNHIIDGIPNENVRILATWILRTKNDPTYNKTGERYKRECAYRCIQAWNAHRKGNTLKKLQYKTTYDMVLPL